MPPTVEVSPGVTVDPEIMGGQPYIKGTRIPTAAFRRFHEDGAGSFNIMSEYPGINARQIADTQERDQ